ncbi:hypothetical protein LTR16_000034 [Cryomyces antarcticus]|uniref:Peptide hydrolase n=1 Tax=Cryomyces antarcticus TaxID=329879 RepID=A0ABR0M2F5_9PEZI|nr:hypothetical protein LTR16_000034 [Cryomyces antarcticus]
MAPRKPKTRNPLAFTPLPVTIISSIVYAGLIAALLVVHLVIPSAPSNSTPVKGVNTTEAWADLKELSNGFHPYNSRRNDQVRDWLLRRIETILARNEVKHSTESLESVNDGLRPWNATAPAPVVVFNDMTSNITFSSAATHTSVYFEGTNIIVYIRGSEDEGGDWWKQNSSLMASKAYSGKGGVLVNAHYDSVSTGFGATDDGVGVVTVLQLISYFTSPGKKPRKGIVALLNNGEEDYLNGARAFVRHPIAQFPHAFLNLEGAGAGGRATLFRSTDTEVTSMMLSAWLAVAWFLLRIADFARPTALNRIYSLIWLYIGSFVIVVAVTVAEQRLQIAGGYFMVIYFAAIFAALLVSYLELFALPKKSVYVRHMAEASRQGSLTPVTRRSSIVSARPVAAPTTDDRPRGRDGPQGDEGEDATETTSLLRGDRGTSFARYRGRRSNGATDGATEEHEQEHRDALLDEAFGDEQPWSGSLPRWLWVIQFLLLAPIVIVLVGQVGLLLTSALSQTAADGSAVFTVYIAIAILSVLILAPLVPFLHRFTFHIPTFLFLVFVGTLVYNLFAFPFSPNNRLKVYFVQQVDLDSGLNRVSLTGLADYVEQIIAEIPSAHGSSVCGDPEWSNRAGLTTCSWDGLPPRVVSSLPEGVPPEKGYAEWVDYNVSHTEAKNEATFTLFGKNTRACRLLFNSPISDFHVEGAASDSRFEPVAEAGSTEIRLWSREWEKPWTVHVSWKGEGEVGLDGKAVCLWSDANESGTVPALDEIRRFMPVWSAVSKGSDGLVEGYKHFSV